ncbi:2-hydroxy-3-keto-5-methylthiopentenyl-1-phosphate phosphatase [Ectobacillus ponti]|uniref:2-hydroxy-3-keto-5-methylthiopentenyl-1-phosphate phosphatase n=1 Tax=Ectobacillus ponti TaxID=2961894 RepID=A0AA41XDC9_9BACI|nr:2-hydroxy-3-keto-5-methylthiopentenyl-1-phosphate phosphatase [Ectobacillus ponti]MCP8970815.1 2-hydroxy-3-keto-5-methylthiopentenyl-1-phosphate phosphatase [Ectobacillus ponti]
MIQIFCDFDGTITKSDNIIAIMKQFGPPETNVIKDQVLAQEISIREGVSRMFALLPSSLKEDIVNFVKETGIIRPGFPEFVQFTKEQCLDFYVISGGMDFFVHPMLDGLVERDHVYCNATDFSGTHIHVDWIHPCDGHCGNACGLCKPSLIRKLGKPGAMKILIGDSITDLQAAKLADKVFARDFLITKCEELGIPYTPFETFADVQQELAKLLEVAR